MAKKLTTEEFLEKAQGIHGDRYEYPGLVYTNNHTKISILCNKHGVFFQTPNSHINQRSGCPQCADELHGDKTRGTQESFVKKARDVHGDRYDYSRTVYKGRHKSAIFICKSHGEFLQTPSNHLISSGCLGCSRENSASIRRSSMEEFIRKANGVHKNKYTYTGEYVNNHTKVQITCREHGVTFLQTPNSHLNGNGCFICGTRDNAIKRRMSPEAWKQRADEVHGNKYDYSKVAYETSNSKVTIICPAHKKPTEFIQLAKNHLMGWGCPECKKVTLRELHSIDHDEFIRRARKRHGNRYNYDDTVYLTSSPP